MKIDFAFSDTDRMTTITAQPQDYDAPVLAPVQIHAVPQGRNSDRLHAAAALLFHDQISGLQDLGPDHPCSRHVAIEIARFFAPVDVSVHPQRLTPRGVPPGRFTAALQLVLDGVPRPVTCDRTEGDLLLRLLPDAAGAIFAEHEIAIATNLSQGTGGLDDSLPRVIRLIGAALLFAEEMQISTLRLPGGWQDPASSERLDRVAALLTTVGLSLDIDRA